jgi:protein-L-isoaspartate(D-aspartate) O-methyltransferase
VHRPRWWNYSEQAFTSEWVDPSSDLDYRRREALTARLFEPIVDGIAERFAYDGPAADYFWRSVSHAQADLSPARRLRMLASYHLWQRLTGNASSRLADDAGAAPLFRRARADSLARIEQTWGDDIRPDLREAVLEEPRERYVPDDHAADSWRDAAVPLLEDDSSTLSAIHAYLTNYTLLDLREGDHLLEVGSGTGYGAALAARIVGETGSVVTFEIAPELADQARANLAAWPNVSVLCGDALVETELPPFSKAVFTCAVDAVPEQYLAALPEGGRLVAPLMKDGSAEQELTMYERVGGRLAVSHHGAVRYVRGVPGEGSEQE